MSPEGTSQGTQEEQSVGIIPVERPPVGATELVIKPEANETIGIEKNESPDQNPLTVELRKNQRKRDEATNEIRGLAELIDKSIIPLAATDQGPDHATMMSTLAKVLQAKGGELGVLSGKEEEIAEGLIMVENKLIAPFIQQINEAHKNAEPDVLEKSQETIYTVRESLYSLVIKNIATGEKLTELIDAINFSVEEVENAEQVSGDQDIVCFFTSQDGRREITICPPALNLDQYSRKHVLLHEIGHLYAESTDIWQPPGVYENFLTFCQNPTDEAINQLSQQNPALSGLLRVLQNPKETTALWNAYIEKRLIRLDAMPEGKEKALERVRVGKELVAEMYAAYFKNGESSEEYLAERTMFSKPEEIFDYLMQVSGCSSFGEFKRFCAEKGVDLDDLKGKSAGELVRGLAAIDEFAPLFRLNEDWRGMLKEYFANQSQQIKPNNKNQKIEERDSQSMGGNISGGESGGPVGSGINPLSKLWGLMTGKRSNEAG